MSWRVSLMPLRPALGASRKHSPQRGRVPAICDPDSGGRRQPDIGAGIFGAIPGWQKAKPPSGEVQYLLGVCGRNLSRVSVYEAVGRFTRGDSMKIYVSAVAIMA